MGIYMSDYAHIQEYVNVHLELQMHYSLYMSCLSWHKQLSFELREGVKHCGRIVLLPLLFWRHFPLSCLLPLFLLYVWPELRPYLYCLGH